MFTRRTATVTISAPDASKACAITANDEYLPVPTIKRDLKVRPAMTNGVSVNSQLPTKSTITHSTINNESPIKDHESPNVLLATAHEIDDLDRVALVDDDVGKPLALDDLEVVLDRHATRIDIQTSQQGRNRERLIELEAFAVECDLHERTRPVRGRA